MFAINFNGGGSIPGPYDDPTDAATNGVQIGKPFYTGTGGLIYGYAEGTVLIRTA